MGNQILETEIERRLAKIQEDIAFVFKNDIQHDKELYIKTSFVFGNKAIKEAKIITNIELTSLHIQKIQVLVTLHSFNDYKIKRSGAGLRIILKK